MRALRLLARKRGSSSFALYGVACFLDLDFVDLGIMKMNDVLEEIIKNRKTNEKRESFFFFLLRHRERKEKRERVQGEVVSKYES